jgi:hypothetical protein
MNLVGGADIRHRVVPTEHRQDNHTREGARTPAAADHSEDRTELCREGADEGLDHEGRERDENRERECPAGIETDWGARLTYCSATSSPRSPVSAAAGSP